MVDATVLFATNRSLSPGSQRDFTDQPGAPGAAGVIYARATVAGVDIGNPASGTITATTPLYRNGFAADDLAPLLASGKDVLVFVHGCANSFEDAITRAAYNGVWLAAAGLSDNGRNISDFDVIAFTWPSRSYIFANIVGDYVDYRHDQAMAEASPDHFGLFLKQISALRQKLGNRRLNLLCHSMGNYMLGFAVEAWFAEGSQPATPLFDEVVLAAADEPAGTFAMPNGGRLSNLWRLAREITVYSATDDIAMALSQRVNKEHRLGYEGPANKADLHFFSPNVYEFVDCTGVDDYISDLVQAPDRSHQYYRQSPTVRADIVQTLAGQIPRRPRYDAAANTYDLFPSAGRAAAAAAPEPV